MGAPVIHFEINVHKTKKAVAFYRNIFGWKIDRIEKMHGGMSHATVRKTGPKGIAGGIAGTNSKGVTMYMEVKDIEGTFRKVKKQGGKVTRKIMEIPGMGRIGWFRDPAGNEIGLWTTVKR